MAGQKATRTRLRGAMANGSPERPTFGSGAVKRRPHLAHEYSASSHFAPLVVDRLNVFEAMTLPLEALPHDPRSLLL